MSDLMELLRTEILNSRLADPTFGEKFLARVQYCETQRPKLEYYGLYTMAQVAVQLCEVSGATEADVDTSSVKRWIKAGRLASVKHGEKGVRIFGYQIADFHLNAVRGEKWDGVERRKTFRLPTGSSEQSPAPTSGTVADGMQSPSKHIVSALASGLTAKKN